MLVLPTLLSCVSLLVLRAASSSPTAKTTSGFLFGSELDGVNAFKGIRFAQAPVDDLRWEPPVMFTSNSKQNATVLPPACIQQFTPFESRDLIIKVYDTPGPPGEAEDCLFLNVWAPTFTNYTLKPVVVWLFGGAHEFGTGSLPLYDGTSMAKYQDIVVVTFNYRTNVFGFPSAPDLPLTGNNLGYLDQEVAFQWVQDNIAAFGGDKTKVTIMGQSAGAQAVADAITRHTPGSAPFRAGILLSGTRVSTNPAANFSAFDDFATAVDCKQAPGAERLACLRAVPAATIRAFVNGPTTAEFGTAVVDNFTVFADALERIRAGLTAHKPIVIGATQDDGSFFAIRGGETSLTAFLEEEGLSAFVDADEVRALYPGQNDSAVIADVLRDIIFRCPASLWAAAVVGAGVPDVFRYSYGAVFTDLQIFPGAGAYHASELPELFGTFDTTTATSDEVTLSSTLQTAFANFIKNPTASLAENWPKYVPGNATRTLAKIAYNGNVSPDNFVQVVQSDSEDGPCTLWDKFLDVRV